MLVIISLNSAYLIPSRDTVRVVQDYTGAPNAHGLRPDNPSQSSQDCDELIESIDRPVAVAVGICPKRELSDDRVYTRSARYESAHVC